MICPSCRSQNDDTAETCFKCGKGLYALTEGALVSGRYEIVSPLGKGGMGIVYRARDRELEETVALKVLRADIASSPELVKRFRSEIRLARKVSHRNVCRIHEYGKESNLAYIVMEFIEGVDLKRVMRRRGPLPPEEAYDIAIQVAKALQAIHDAGIVHRDLKTPNIMLDWQGVVKLMDFGIAKSFESGTTGATATGLIVGTPEYMSPEQAQGQKVDARSDIYALGVVTWELFTGDVPFRGEMPVATLLKHLQAPVPVGSESAARLPRPLVPILTRALAKSREDRFGSAREMADALKQARAESFPSFSTPIAKPVFSATAPMPEPAADTTPMPTPIPTPVPTAVPTAVDTPAAAAPAARVVPGRGHPARRPSRPMVRPRAAPRHGGPLFWAAAIGVLAVVLGVALVLIGRRFLPSGSAPEEGVTQGTATTSEEPPSTVAEAREPAFVQSSTPAAEAQRPPVPQPMMTTSPESNPGAQSTLRAPLLSLGSVRPPPPQTPSSTPETLRASAPAVSTLPLRPAASTESPQPREQVTAMPPITTPSTPRRDTGSADSVAAAERSETSPSQGGPAGLEPAREDAGLLQVGVRPYAEVAVDGTAIGATPLRAIKLSAGVHTVRLTHPDYRPFVRKVTIRVGETTKLTIDLSLDGIKK